nr:hypothetical protein [Phytoactinopolyspora halophila]
MTPHESAARPGFDLAGFNRLADELEDEAIMDQPGGRRDHFRHAVGYVQDWLAQPTVEFLVPGVKHLDIALRLVESMGTAGNLTTGVQLAAYAIEQQGEVYSNDPDFGRFPELTWINPLA